MPIAWYALIGLFVALPVNCAADAFGRGTVWQPGAIRLPARHAGRRHLVMAGLPALFGALAAVGHDRVAVTGSLAAVLVLLAVVDLEQRRLPNVVVLPALVAASGLSNDPLNAALAASVAFAGFLGLWALGRRLFGPGALGMGDVKLAAVVGAVLGWPMAVNALLAGMLLAGGFAFWLLLSGRAGRGALLPYGVFLIVAALAALLV